MSTLIANLRFGKSSSVPPGYVRGQIDTAWYRYDRVLGYDVLEVHPTDLAFPVSELARLYPIMSAIALREFLLIEGTSTSGAIEKHAIEVSCEVLCNLAFGIATHEIMTALRSNQASQPAQMVTQRWQQWAAGTWPFNWQRTGCP